MVNISKLAFRWSRNNWNLFGPSFRGKTLSACPKLEISVWSDINPTIRTWEQCDLHSSRNNGWEEKLERGNPDENHFPWESRVEHCCTHELRFGCSQPKIKKVKRISLAHPLMRGSHGIAQWTESNAAFRSRKTDRVVLWMTSLCPNICYRTNI